MVCTHLARRAARLEAGPGLGQLHARHAELLVVAEHLHGGVVAEGGVQRVVDMRRRGGGGIACLQARPLVHGATDLAPTAHAARLEVARATLALVRAVRTIANPIAHLTPGHVHAALAAVEENRAGAHRLAARVVHDQLVDGELGVRRRAEFDLDDELEGVPGGCCLVQIDVGTMPLGLCVVEHFEELDPTRRKRGVACEEAHHARLRVAGHQVGEGEAGAVRIGGREERLGDNSRLLGFC